MSEIPRTSAKVVPSIRPRSRSRSPPGGLMAPYLVLKFLRNSKRWLVGSPDYSGDVESSISAVDGACFKLDKDSYSGIDLQCYSERELEIPSVDFSSTGPFDRNCIDSPNSELESDGSSQYEIMRSEPCKPQFDSPMFDEISPYLLNNSFSSSDEVDFNDDSTSDKKELSLLNGHISPFETEDNRDQLSPAEDDDLSNISVKQLTASYLSAAEQSPRKRSPSPNSTPIRPRTPISRLVGTYLNSSSSESAVNSINIQASSPNGTTNQLYPSDFTPGITLKSLKSAYEASARKNPSPPQCSSPAKEEVHVSFSQLREAYCNVASNSPREGNSPTPRATTPLKTPSTFRSMIQI